MKLVPLCLPLAACTTLGPMPATTAVSAIPAGRPGIEAQAGLVPGFYLSRAAEDSPGGSAFGQMSALVDLDRWVLRGLVVGTRVFGQHADTPTEPYIGYRRRLDEVFAFAGIVYGTSKRSTNGPASYHATRFGGEALADIQLAAPATWLGIHLQGSLSATAISASGTYCVDAGGIAIDCSADHPEMDRMVDGTLSGLYPAGTVGIALDLGRGPTGRFHAARIAVLAAAGRMPLVRDGIQQTGALYTSAGITFTLGLGAAD